MLIWLLAGVVLVELGVMVATPFLYRAQPFRWARTTSASLLIGGEAIVVLLALLAEDWGNLLPCSLGVAGFTLVYYVLALLRARAVSAQIEDWAAHEESNPQQD